MWFMHYVKHSNICPVPNSTYGQTVTWMHPIQQINEWNHRYKEYRCVLCFYKELTEGECTSLRKLGLDLTAQDVEF